MGGTLYRKWGDIYGSYTLRSLIYVLLNDISILMNGIINLKIKNTIRNPEIGKTFVISIFLLTICLQIIIFKSKKHEQ